MRRCILHLGHPKTATTYLQQVFHLNEAKFAANDYWIPTDFCPFGSHNFGDLARSGAVFSGNLEPVFYATEANDRETANKILHHVFYENKCENLILSSELYFYYIWEVRDIIKRANSAGYRVDVIVYLQRQERAIVGAYLQNIRNHNFYDSLEVFIDEERFELLGKYDEVLNEYKIEVPNRLIVRTFDRRFLIEREIVCDFLTSVGLSIGVENLERPRVYANRSLPLEWYEVLRKENRDENQMAIDVIRSANPDRPLDNDKRILGYYLNEDINHIIIQRYGKTNENLVNCYFADRSWEECNHWLSIEPPVQDIDLDGDVMAACLSYLTQARHG